MANLVLKNLVKSYESVQIIPGIDLEIKSGEFVVFVGPSGCGKSTLLRMIAGLEEVTSGDIFIDDENVTNVAASKRGISMVFQSYALYPHMTVRENLSFGLKNMNCSKEYIKQQILHAADVLQLSDHLDRLPSQLSGGQRQRVAIGRSIVRNPKIFLFDEPLSNLDAELRVQMRHELIKLHKKLGNTMIYVTHDQVEAMTMADRIVVLNKGEISQVGTPLSLYNHPKNIFTANFIGSPKINLLKAKVIDALPNKVVLNIFNKKEVTININNHSLSVGDDITLGVRPEHVSTEVNSADILFDMDLDAVEALGDSTYLYAKLYSEHDFRVKLQGQHQFEETATITLGIQLENVVIFDANGNAVPINKLDKIESSITTNINESISA